jgi:hypothetical protein
MSQTNELEKIIQLAKTERPLGGVVITWNPNTGQLNVQAQGDLSAPEAIYCIEVAKKLLLERFAGSPIIKPGQVWPS